MKLWISALFMSLMGLSSAHAQSVSLKAGTAGTGLDVALPMGQNLNLRLGQSSYETDREVKEEDINYQAQLTLGGTNAWLDWFPAASSRFRWTLGVFAPKHQLIGQAQANEGGTIEINNVSYPAAALGELDLSVKWGSLKPYLGVGLDGSRAAKGGLYYNLDLGVIFAGSPKVTLNASCPDPVVCAAIEGDLRAEEAKMVEDFKKYQYLPVIQLGLGYRF